MVRVYFLRSGEKGAVMKLAVLLSCCALTFGQNTSPVPETNSHNPTTSSEPQQSARPSRSFIKHGAYGSPGSSIQQATQAAAAQASADHGQRYGIDILSDTQGVDFGPYLQRILQNVRETWYHLIPASASMKRGKLAIEFAIKKDGKVAEMRLVGSSGDVDL